MSKSRKWLFGLGMLSFGLYFFKKTWRNVLTKIMMGSFGICFALNLYLFIEIYPSAQIDKIYAEYSKIETCDEMQKRFVSDLKNEGIKYFHFGLGTSIDQNKLLKNKYNITVYSMGCLVRSEMKCYNNKVNDYLQKKINTSISKILKETQYENNKKTL